jgi:hypothetical protein
LKIVTDNQCQACGTRRKKKLLVFSDNFVPYCNSYWICNESHPNHPSQKDMKKLYQFAEVQAMMANKVPDEAHAIRQLMNKPLSVRISDYKTIRFLLDIKKQEELATISDAVRHCIDYTIKDHRPSTVAPVKPLEPSTKLDEEDLSF